MPMQMAPSIEPAAATPYLEVNGMVTPEVLMDDEEYKEVMIFLFAAHMAQSPRMLLPKWVVFLDSLQMTSRP